MKTTLISEPVDSESVVVVVQQVWERYTKQTSCYQHVVLSLSLIIPLQSSS